MNKSAIIKAVEEVVKKYDRELVAIHDIQQSGKSSLDLTKDKDKARTIKEAFNYFKIVLEDME